MTGRGYGKKGDIWDLKDMRVVHFSDKWEKVTFYHWWKNVKMGEARAPQFLRFQRNR